MGIGIPEHVIVFLPHEVWIRGRDGFYPLLHSLDGYGYKFERRITIHYIVIVYSGNSGGISETNLPNHGAKIAKKWIMGGGERIFFVPLSANTTMVNMEKARGVPGFVIAAPTSGAGKTTVARGLMAALMARGLRVQPFKCGPDYIDTQFHAAVCGRASVNLDLFMASEGHVKELYRHYTADADIAVVEGMMGMYDGYDAWRGSTADVARVLGLPVILVADAKAAGFSLAPLLYGFLNYNTKMKIAGVIFNRVGSPRHCEMLSQVCESVGIECLGTIPKQKALETPSRYLGLDTTSIDTSDYLNVVADNVNLDKLLEVCREG